MAIPQYQDFMTPVLTAFQDNKPKNHSEVERIVVPQLHLTKEDCAQLLPSGTQTIVRNRLSWAIYYMYRAGLLQQKKRGVYIITEEGKKALQSGKTINNTFLEQFSSFQVFQNKTNKEENKQEETDPATRISNAIEEFNKRTQLELLEQLKTVDPVFFEKICLQLMQSMGYGEKVSLTPKSHDGGIDGIINEDVLGLDKIYLQAKRYSTNKVNEKEMRDFVGALTLSQTQKGVFITTSDFDKKAIDMAARKNIILIDGDKLTSLMIRYNVGVQTKETYQIKELDLSFFSED